MSQSQNSGEKPKRRLTFYERGPGPAAYTLPPLLGRPSHAVTHRINPNCPIGIKLGRTVKSLGPGPAYYDIEYGQKANGTSRGVAYTMRKKFPPRDGVVSPGPAAYSICGVDLLRTKLPKYTMRIRPPAQLRAVTPAPNAYDLPPMLGPKVLTRPARLEASMKGNRVDKKRGKLPGFYDIGRPEIVKSQAPGYTMRIKWADLRKLLGPGPAAYHAVRNIFPKRPAWPFGIKHTDFAGILKNKCAKMTSSPCSCG